jgi:hypothetical protein
MGRVKSGWIGVAVAGVLVLAMGCVNADFEGDVEEASTKHSTVQLEARSVQFEQISWQSGIGGDAWRNKLPDQSVNVCECSGLACQEEWVDSNFGCDICVTIQCASLAPEHVCVSC